MQMETLIDYIYSYYIKMQNLVVLKENKDLFINSFM